MFIGSKRMMSILARSNMEGHAPSSPKYLGGDSQSFALRAAPLAKNCRANSDKRRPFFDSNGKIIRHAHGKVREFHLKFSFKLVAQFPKIDKILTRRFRLLRQRRARVVT